MNTLAQDKYLNKSCLIKSIRLDIQKISLTKLIISYIEIVEKYRPDIVLRNRAILKARKQQNTLLSNAPGRSKSIK